MTFSFYCIYLIIALNRFIFSFYKPKKNNKSIAFFACFSHENAGFNYRVKKWADILTKHGYKVKTFQIYSDSEISSLPLNFNRFLVKGMVLRYIQIIRSIKYENVIIRRELLLYNEYGDLFYEKLLVKIHPEAILDFDDHISIAKEEPRKVSIYGRLLLENGNKFSQTTKIYKNFIAGNDFLNSLLKKTANTIIIPTCVDYKLSKNYNSYNNKKINIGWVGSNGNQKYLDLIIKDLNKLVNITALKLTVISGKAFKSDIATFEIINIPWSLKTEKVEISKLDFGIMPLTNDNYVKGKCSFKAIQYMGLGVIPVISNVGMNNKLVEDGINGFLINENKWCEKFNFILSLENKDLDKISKRAHNKVSDNYSFKEHTLSLINYLNQIKNR